MTLKELMLGNIQSNQGTAGLQIGAQTAQKSSSKSENPAFGDILGSRLSNAERQEGVRRNDSNVSAGRKNTERVSDKADNKPRYLSFREAKEMNLKASASESNAGHETKLSKSENRQPDKVENDSKKDTAQENQPNNMLYVFAQVLGLEIRDLQKLLKEADITSESFNDMQDISENVSKLSQLLGLNSEQEDILVKILQLTGEKLDSLTAVREETDVPVTSPSNAKAAINSVETAGSAGTAKAVKTAETVAAAETQPSSEAAVENETLPTASTFETLAKKLNLKILVKLDELSKKLEADQSAAESELKQLMQPLLEKTGVKLQEPLNQGVGESNGETAEQISIAAGAKAETAPSGDDGAGQEANAKAEKETVARQSVTAVKETQPQAAFAVVQPNKVNGADVIEKTIAKTPAAAKEIISQVIEKAKVILTPDKSEMVMDLKPDSLGKISLKVVTENGIVMAKFVADSQQVRQVLEANMHLLKDSLEKQGMSVQGFSVSVRQDSNQSAGNRTPPQSSKGQSLTGTAYRAAGIEGSLVDVLEATSRINPYKWGGSTINITA